MIKYLKIKSNKAFTLLELVVVTVVIAILAAIAIPNFQGVITRANDAKAQTTMAAIARDAMYLYKFDNGATPLDWYNAYNEAVAETPTSANLYLAIESNLTLTLDLPHATYQEIQAAAALAASVEGPAPATAGPSTNPNQLSIFVNGSNNVGMAIASSGNCILGTLVGQEITTWSAQRDLGADCAGSIAFVDPVTVAALEVRDVSEYSNLTIPLTGTLGAPTIAPSSISFAINFVATPTAPIDSFEISRNGTVLHTALAAPISSYTDNTASNGTSYTYSVRAQNSMGYSTSVSTSAVTSYAVPEAPSFPILQAGDALVNVGWVSPQITAAAPISGYRLYRSQDSGPFVLAATITPETTLSYSDTGLTNGASYAYQLESYGIGGASSRSPTSASVTPITAPEQIVITTTTTSPGLITVNFTTSAPISAPITSITVTRDSILYTTLASSDITFTDISITNGVAYTYAFTAHNSVSSSTPTSVTLTSYDIPNAPNLTTQTAATAQNTLFWNNIPSTMGTPVTGYRIYRSVSSGPFIYLTQQASNSYTDLTLNNGTTYIYQIETYGAGGTSSRTTSSALTPLAAPVITQAEASAVNPTTGSITYTTTSSISQPTTGVRIYNNATGALLVTGTANPILVPGLTAGNSYIFDVEPYNLAAIGAKYQTNTMATISTVTSTANLTPTAINSTIELNWTQITSTTAQPVDTYQLQVSPDGTSNWSTIYQGALLTFTHTALTNGTEYYYRVAAVNDAGVGTYSTTATSTPTAAPQAPAAPTTTLATTSIALSLATVTGTVAAPVTGYRIYRSVAGSAYLYLTQQASTSYNDTGLTQGVTYSYQATAYGPGGESDRSTTTPLLTPIGTPATITNLDSTGGAPSVSISWNAATSTAANPVTSIEVLKSGVVVATLAASATTYTYTALTSGADPGTAYTFSVRPINALTTAASTSVSVSLYNATATANYTCNSGGSYNGTGTAAGSCGQYQTAAAYYDCPYGWNTWNNGGTCMYGYSPMAEYGSWWGGSSANATAFCQSNGMSQWIQLNGSEPNFDSNYIRCGTPMANYAPVYHAATYANYPAATLSSYTYSCPSGGTVYATQCKKITG